MIASVNLGKDDLNFTLDVSDMTDMQIRETTAQMLNSVNKSLFDQPSSDEIFRVVNPESVTVTVDSSTHMAHVSARLLGIRVRTKHVEGVPPHVASVNVDGGTLTSNLRQKVGSAVNSFLKRQS